MQLNIPPMTAEYRDRLKLYGHGEEYAQAAWDCKHAVDQLWSDAAGQHILDECHRKGYLKKPLKFKMWFDGYVVGQTPDGNRYIVIGSYGPYKRFILNGICKNSRKGCAMQYSFNGQAGRGSKQVAHIAEQDFVEFPEVNAKFEHFQKLPLN